jgi:hypothetical protein
VEKEGRLCPMVRGCCSLGFGVKKGVFPVNIPDFLGRSGFTIRKASNGRGFAVFMPEPKRGKEKLIKGLRQYLPHEYVGSRMEGGVEVS